MFGLFSPPPVEDPVLGTLKRSGGLWRGTLRIAEATAPLALPGPRAAPDPQALEVARSIASGYPGWRDSIAAALFEHYAPYAEADAPEGEPCRIAQPEQVWTHATVDFVAVIPLEGGLGVEIGYRVAWDEEHTVGARLSGGRLVELNGSVLAP